jgi:hypothetical protein
VLNGCREIGEKEFILDLTPLEGEVQEFSDDHNIVEIDVLQQVFLGVSEQHPRIFGGLEDTVDGEHLTDRQRVFVLYVVVLKQDVVLKELARYGQTRVGASYGFD